VPGQWGGLIFNAGSTASIDHALITYGGGRIPIEGDFDQFNAIEVHQADLRLTNSVLENNAAGGIVVAQGTKLMLIGTIHSTGSGWGLQCDDKESSVGNVGLLDGTVSDTCTDFDH